MTRVAEWFGLTVAQLVGAVIGWGIGIALAIACIESTSIFRGVILPCLIGIPAALFFMWMGSRVE